MRIAVVGTVMSIMQASGAFAQDPCSIGCSADRVPFAGCQPSALEQARPAHIGIIGKASILTLGPNCMGRVSIEVLKSSEDVPPRIQVEYDPCERWGSHEGKVVDFYVWKNRRSGSEVYSHAPCPR